MGSETQRGWIGSMVWRKGRVVCPKSRGLPSHRGFIHFCRSRFVLIIAYAAVQQQHAKTGSTAGMAAGWETV